MVESARSVQGCNVASDEATLLPHSEADLLGQEWDHFQRNLLLHIELHLPGKCDGLVYGYQCVWCKQFFGDPFRGKTIGRTLALYTALDGVTSETSEDDGFDPDAF